MALTKELLQSDVEAVAVEQFKTTLGTDEVTVGKENVVFAEIVDGKVKEYVEPTIEFTRWAGEERLTLSYPTATGFSDKVLNDGELKLSADTEEFYFRQHDQDTMKFGLVLKEKPSNDHLVIIDGKEYYQWALRLQGWKNFDFFYQPPLTKEEIKRGFIRPDDVVGSWAVYHKTKRNHIEGQTNYATGKVGHFLRPRFIDADGDICWADLSIKDGIYTVSVNADWLANAVYPVKANDTFGYTGHGGTPGVLDQNFASALKSTLSVDGSVSKITVYCDASSVNGKGIIYSHNSGTDTPNALQGSTNATTVTSTTAEFDFTFPSALSLSSGTYWNGIVANGRINIYADSIGSPWRTNNYAPNSYASPSASWSGGDNYDGLAISIYATYTPSGGGGFVSGGSLKNIFIEW